MKLFSYIVTSLLPYFHDVYLHLLIFVSGGWSQFPFDSVDEPEILLVKIEKIRKRIRYTPLLLFIVPLYFLAIYAPTVRVEYYLVK